MIGSFPGKVQLRVSSLTEFGMIRQVAAWIRFTWRLQHMPLGDLIALLCKYEDGIEVDDDVDVEVAQ